MALKNLISNYYNGNPNRRDFTEADLPDNRIALFRTALSVRKGSMLGLNVLYLVFWIPAILWTALNLAQANLILTDAAADAAEMFRSLVFTYLLFMVPCIALTGPFNAAVSYISRNWARDEHSLVWLDFKAALKENWKQGLLFGIINGVVPLMMYICIVFYTSTAAQNVIFYIPLCLTVMIGFLWILSTQLIPTLMVTYYLKFTQLIRNAFLMTLATLPRAVGIFLLTMIFPILLIVSFALIPNIFSYVCIAFILFFGLFGLSFNKLLVASYANMVCEKYLNPKIEGSRTNIGLRSVQNVNINE